MQRKTEGRKRRHSDRVSCLTGSLVGLCALRSRLHLHHLNCTADKTVKRSGHFLKRRRIKNNKTPQNSHRSAIHADSVSFPSLAVLNPSLLLLFLFYILKFDVSCAVSLNKKSIQIEPKGKKDLVVRPATQIAAAPFAALCW